MPDDDRNGIFFQASPIDPKTLSVTPGVLLPAAVDLLTAYTFTSAELLFFPHYLKAPRWLLSLFSFPFSLLSSSSCSLLLPLRPLRCSRLSDVERCRWPLFKHLSYRHRSAWHRRRRGRGNLPQSDFQLHWFWTRQMAYEKNRKKNMQRGWAHSGQDLL